MRNSFYIYSILLISFACNSPDKKGLGAKVIPVKSAEIETKETPLSKIVERVEVIPLETSKESLIGNFHKVIEFKDGFLVQDSPGRDKILQFDQNGSFVRTIGSTGHAPEEYISIADFDYDDKTEEVYILDNGRRLSIKKYDLKTGKYRGDLLYKGAFGTQFKKLTNGNWAVAGITDQEPFAFFSADSSFTKTLGKAIPLKPYFDAFAIPEMFTNSDDKILFRTGVTDTIYEIKGDVLNPYLYIDFEKKISEDMYEREFGQSNPQTVMTLPIKIEGMHEIYSFLENNNFTYFNFLFSGQAHYAFYNRKNSNKIIIPSKLLINDFIGTGSDNFNMLTKSYDGKSFIGVIESTDINKKKLRPELLDKHAYGQLMRLTENANPVLIRYYLSNF